MNRLIIVRSRDLKMQNWIDASASGDTEFVELKSSAVVIRKLLTKLFSPKMSCSIVFRYLNDSPSFVRSFITLINDFVIVFFSLISRSKIIWICHNLDRETKVYFPFISRFRRWLLSRAARKIFVTDPYLLEHAKDYFKADILSKFDWTCFGNISSYGAHKSWGSQTDSAVKCEVERFVSDQRRMDNASRESTLIGLCLGRPGKKYLHYTLAVDLLDQAQAIGKKLALIVAVDMGKVKCERQMAALSELRKRSNVLFYDREIGFDESEMLPFYDFVWRILDDFSVPITIYCSATNRVPVLTMDYGFVGELVKKYRIGFVIDKDWSNLGDFFVSDHKALVSDAPHFLSERGWEKGAAKLFSA